MPVMLRIHSEEEALRQVLKLVLCQTGNEIQKELEAQTSLYFPSFIVSQEET